MRRIPESNEYISDGLKIYEFLDRKRHRREKYKETNRNEGLHSFLRDKLACLRRRTKAYLKSRKALNYYLALITIYWGFL